MKFKLILDKESEELITAVVHQRSTLTDQIEALVLEHAGSDAIAAFTEDDMRMLPYKQIACFTVLEGKTLAIDVAGKQYRVKQRLYEIEQQLPSSFFRINKSSIANEAALEKFTSTYSGGINAKFKCGYEDYVSRRCFSTIKRRFQVK
jgi:DNA-binding LytR/AlgR family response regulator